MPLGVGNRLDEGNGMVGIGIAAAHDLLPETLLYRRQAVIVPLLGFEPHPEAGIGGRGIGAIAGRLGFLGEAGSGLGRPSRQFARRRSGHMRLPYRRQFVKSTREHGSSKISPVLLKRSPRV